MTNYIVQNQHNTDFKKFTKIQVTQLQKLKMLSYFVGLEEELVYFLVAEIVVFFSIFVMRSLLKPDDTVLKALWQREDEDEVFYDALSCKKI
ncbi:unnamed protein product [Nezara viridula]|uniref:Uncharacterized protein n=1 Tax=Nezara viridula TaxID=85310 RepID=A0A9P0MT83_NEZVI|nr:unnamed protein product [Nezara viridula]